MTTSRDRLFLRRGTIYRAWQYSFAPHKPLITSLLFLALLFPFTTRAQQKTTITSSASAASSDPLLKAMREELTFQHRAVIDAEFHFNLIGTHGKSIGHPTIKLCKLCDSSSIRMISRPKFRVHR